ncbi:MAG TPA: substrate-binding domain-containing protein [Bradyrhizobium sp.]|uniref:molybdate ABC transporter substrate-binding protein n=1 Tax=Bradyrhizobium sp. TaxID=376 RepID=UPI002BE6CA79|nr:substrate-binding domain-containing protein [Bradyrhizobium sp.]HLZ04998.1 substrate-binding domain-containing protein [Bradyrhizobium sp.]
MSHLNILSGGAAHSLIASLAPTFKAKTGFEIKGEFGAVGGMAEKLRSGVATDIIILTSALVAKLVEEKLVVSSSIKDVGLVETALAVRSGGPRVYAQNADALRAAFLAADAIFVPDTKASTAGIHVAKVLAQLGITDEVIARLKIYPNGATAMRELAASTAKHPIGCTQSTEIISTSGVELCGALPKGCELATMYTAGTTTSAAHEREAQALINLLTSAEARDARALAGFL